MRTFLPGIGGSDVTAEKEDSLVLISVGKFPSHNFRNTSVLISPQAQS
jgi:hypothetical protein